MKRYQLPKEFAEKWIQALRSGKYKQTSGRLYSKNQDSYCCLGVCGVINNISIDRLSIGGSYDSIRDSFSAYVDSSAIKEDCIPIELTGCPSENELVGKLTQMNDQMGYTFCQIADWIEANVQFIPNN